MVTHETYQSAAGAWLEPNAVEKRGNATVEIATGAPVEVGRTIKMSKSKKNTVDPDAILASYGADAVRWFVLSDSPPERDLAWSEAGIEGAWRFVQRVWRLASEPGNVEGEPDTKLARALHRGIAGITADIDKLQFNKAVARLYELVSVIERAPGGPTRIEAITSLLRLCSPMVPHLAEEGWAALGQHGLIANAAWPVADAALLEDDTVTIAVQVNGKLKDSFEAAKGAEKTVIEAEAMRREKVVRALEGKTPKKIIIVPDRLVNLVA